MNHKCFIWKTLRDVNELNYNAFGGKHEMNNAIIICAQAMTLDLCKYFILEVLEYLDCLVSILQNDIFLLQTKSGAFMQIVVVWLNV